MIALELASVPAETDDPPPPYSFSTDIRSGNLVSSRRILPPRMFNRITWPKIAIRGEIRASTQSLELYHALADPNPSEYVP